jgi:hypothetical protein
MQPLEGDFYVNLFSHYRPAGGDPEWFAKPDPEAPPPILDVGSCAADGDRVTCDKVDGDLLPFLSPKLETVP